MRYFITTDNGNIEDYNGERVNFRRLNDAVVYVKDNHNNWTGGESQTYYIGTDNGVTWTDKRIISL